MKKNIIITFIIAVLINLVVGCGYFPVRVQEMQLALECEGNVKVGAYYYIWWGIPFNPHWNENIKGTPLLGKYNSNDSMTAYQHILLAEQHQIDFFAVSWMGEGKWIDWDFDDIDRNLQNGLLNALHMQNFNFCLFYETQIVLNTSNSEHENFTEIFFNDMVYAAKHYFNHPNYLHIDDKPVMFIYNLPYLYQNSPLPAQELLNPTRQQLASNGSDIYFIGDVGGGPHTPYNINYDWLHFMNATTTYFFSEPSKEWNEILEDARTYYPEWRNVMNSMGIKFVPNAYPGFNNTGLVGVADPAVLPTNASMFKEMLKIAVNNVDDLKIVMITSWNEWMESTAIEPSMEFGELFLHAIYDVAIPEFFSSTFLSLSVVLTTAAVTCSKKKSPKSKNKCYKQKCDNIVAYAR